MVIPLLLSLTFAAEPVADRPITAKAAFEPAKSRYQSQLLATCDHPITDTFTFAGLVISTRLDDKGALEVDATGSGRFKKLTKSSLVICDVDLPAEEGKRAKAIKLGIFFDRATEGTWTWRSASQLTIALGKEALVAVDVDGDGAFTPGKDGLCWSGSDWLFPLPGAGERFCTATLDLTGLVIGTLGDRIEILGRPLVTTVPEALPILQGINRERSKLGLTPRPENPALSADLQKHCSYMATNGQLAHPEDKGKPGYTDAGHAAGMRSILSSGTPAERIATMMVETYFHRQDVIRPETRAFGVGLAARYGGIDGRSDCADIGGFRWPILCPVPDQIAIPLRYQHEMPDAAPDDKDCGYPITVYFGKGQPKLLNQSLTIVGDKGGPVECYLFAPDQGASKEFSGYQHCVCLIPKDPLLPATTYAVMISAQAGDGTVWERSWRFTTQGGG